MDKNCKFHRILIVDDDQEIRQLLGDFLQAHDYEIYLARNHNEMDKQLKQHLIDLVILDVMLPQEDGLSICQKLREQQIDLPIIILTAMGDEASRILGLELGADDYIAKPFNPRELLARIKAVLRRSHEPVQRQYAHAFFAGWDLDIRNRRLFSEDHTEIVLSSGEYDLLLTLVEHAQKVITRDQLLDITRHREAGPFDRSIDIQISRLRHKIEIDSKNPQLIKTIRNGGYMLAADVEWQ